MGKLLGIGLFLLGLGACSGRTAGNGCGSNNDCGGGLVCIADTCQALCNSDLICEGSCCQEGACGGSCAGRGVPQITQINGTGSTDGLDGHSDNRVQNTLVLEGQNLEGTEVRLTTELGETAVLSSCGSPATKTRMEVELPNNLAAGAYTLAAVNQAGQCSAEVTMLRGETGAACTVASTVNGATVTCGTTSVELSNGAGVDTGACIDGQVMASSGGVAQCLDEVGPMVVKGTQSASLALGSGQLVIKRGTTTEMGIDDKGIQVRDEAGAAPLHLNRTGGSVVVGEASDGAALSVGADDALDSLLTVNGAVVINAGGGNVFHGCSWSRVTSTTGTIVSASCAANHYAVSGGCSSGSAAVTVNSSRPTHGVSPTEVDAWTCSFSAVTASGNRTDVLCCRY